MRGLNKFTKKEQEKLQTCDFYFNNNKDKKLTAEAMCVNIKTVERHIKAMQDTYFEIIEEQGNNHPVAKKATNEVATIKQLPGAEKVMISLIDSIEQTLSKYNETIQCIGDNSEEVKGKTFDKAMMRTVFSTMPKLLQVINDISSDEKGVNSNSIKNITAFVLKSNISHERK